MGIFRRFREAVTSARRNADGDAAAAARAAGAEAPSPGERWPVGVPAFDAAREAYVRTAIAMRREGDLRGAAALLESELPGRPNAIGYYLLGETLLTLGDYRRGWPLLEFRWLHPALVGKRAYYGRPPWIGQDLRGRTVLVQVEQGIGDVIMFVRYLPWLKRLGARVLLVPRVDMATVARRLPGVDQVLDDGAPLPEFDFVVHLMSLPRVFGTTIDTVPDEVPYLAPDASRVARLAPSLGDDGPPRIGIVWAGRPTQSHNALRSIPLPMLRPLLMTPGCRFYSLQKGPAEAELAALPAGTPIVPLGGEFEDLDDLVAAISRMDLVISVCTGPAHLAGAMGKPVWTMIAEPPDLRWLTTREDSPWYPTMRLFRQSAPGDWDGVVARVTRELARGPTAWADLAARRSAPADAARGALPQPPAREERFPGMAELAETRQGLLMFDPDQDRIGRSIRRDGEWLHGRLEIVLRLAAPGDVIVEAAAGIGADSLAIGRAIAPDGRLLLYEIDARHARMLEQNLAANAIANATIVLGALDGAGTVAGDVHARLDDLALARCDGLKVNEGADAAAIMEGARQTLWRCRPWLVLAAEDDVSLGRLASRAREFGYRTFRRATPLHSASNFYRSDDDGVGGASALALVALPEEVAQREPLPGCVELHN